MGTTREESVVEKGDPSGIRQVRAFTLRALRRFVRNRASVFWAIVAPSGYYLFTAVLNAPDDGDAGAVKGVMAIALGVFGALAATQMVFAGNMGADLREKRYRKLRSLPVSPWADLAGRFVAGFVVGVSAFATVLVVGVATGADLALAGPASITVVFAGLFLFCALGVGLGVISAAFVQDSQHLMIVANVLLLGLFFGTGFNGISPESLPAAVRPLVNVLPNSLATRVTILHLSPAATGVEGALTPPRLPSGPAYLLLLAGEAVATSVAAAVAMRRFVYEGEIDE